MGMVPELVPLQVWGREPGLQDKPSPCMGSFPVLVPRQRPSTHSRTERGQGSCCSPQLCLHPGTAGRLPVTSHPWARLLQGLKAQLRPSTGSQGGAELSILSHPAKHQFTAILRKQALISHPILTHITPGQRRHPLLFPQAPHSCIQLSSTALPMPTLYIHSRSRLGSLPPLLHYLASIPHSPSSASNHPQQD